MGADQIHGLLLHHPDDVLVKGGDYIVDAMQNLVERGLVKMIGVSIYDSNNLELLYDRLNPDIVQIPINVLDQRLIDDGGLQYLKSNFPESSYNKIITFDIEKINLLAQ